MGTQQILLIVLSVIIVGVAVAVGIQMFNTQRDSSELQAIASDLSNYGAQVVAYLETPITLGGAENLAANVTASNVAAWLGFDGSQQTVNHNATYTITFDTPNVIITADNAGTSNISIPATATELSDATVSL